MDSAIIQKEISLGYRDKRQIKKLKKEKAAGGATQETNSGFFSRIFTRKTQVNSPA
jgi:chorismate mutase